MQQLQQQHQQQQQQQQGLHSKIQSAEAVAARVWQQQQVRHKGKGHA
jgi:hypothetical protein